MTVIDLRSDTVTLPTPEMRQAMAEAPVGDDVYREDPTVNKLEELAAQMLGKEASLFVSSGTMGNLIALLTHCGRGDEAIIGDGSHIAIHEQASISALAGVFPRIVPNLVDGRLALADIEKNIYAGDDDHFATTRVICLENTWNGMVLQLDYMRDVRELANEYDLAVHLDGARLFNAALALGVKANKIASYFDSVTFCLSKGLSAPVGSVLCGSKEFIAKARRMRKLLGGGTRQAGILAAAGIIGLKKMVDRLAEDHANAAKFASLLAQIPGISVEVDRVDTNMVFFNVSTPGMTNTALCEELRKQGLIVGPESLGIRAVTHYGIEEKDVVAAAEIVKKAVVKQAAMAK